VLLVVTAGALGVGVYHLRGQTAAVVQYKTPQEADPYVRFTMEAYDSIQTNYWMEPSLYNLPEIFHLSFQKALGSDIVLASTTRESVVMMIAEGLKSATTTDAKKQLALNTVGVAVYNLLPVGRNNVLSKQQEVALRQEVSNINPSTDLYKNLGVEKGADTQVVEKAYQEKAAVLAKATTTEAKQELAQVTYAHKVLTNDNSKTLYDQAQIEPTVFGHVLGTTLYLYFSKISPTTLREFAIIVDGASTTPNLDSMIYDLRGNIGGALDFLQYFLGLFIGSNQFAFDLFHQGTYDAQRTVQNKFPELTRYKDIAILTDNMTQSTAELTAATFKRYNLAHVVGATTRGWGTVENTYPLTTDIDPTATYSLLLVNNITLRDDNQPIEGRGIDPDVYTSDKNWKSELSQFFRSPSLIQALKNEAAADPLRY
jgi:C-terminal processing protease CtpA/Prc